jgi:hypothetical protein
MIYDAEEGAVRIVSDKTEGPTAGTHSFEPLEFLARILAHVPRKSEIYVRYYGAYSVRRRAAWRQRGVRPGSHLPEEPVEPVLEVGRARRRRWASSTEPRTPARRTSALQRAATSRHSFA